MEEEKSSPDEIQPEDIVLPSFALDEKGEKEEGTENAKAYRFRQNDPAYMDTPHFPLDNVLFGLILLIVGVVMVSHHEIKAMEKTAFIQKKVDSILELPLDKVDYRNGGKIVHAVGKVETWDFLHDSSFGVMVNAIKLKREVKMYQWKESCVTQEIDGDYDQYGMVRTETQCRYDKVWADEVLHSQHFKEASAYQNPSSFPFQSRTWTAKNVKMGVFKLWPQLVERMNEYEPLAVGSLSQVNLPREFTSKVHLDNGSLYLGSSPQSPEIGDVIVDYKVIRPFKVMTLIARQAADSLAPFEGKKGELSSRLLYGAFSPRDIFDTKSLKEKDFRWLWWVRVVSFILIMCGFHLALFPLRIISHFIPFLRRFMVLAFGMVIFAFSFLLYFIILGFLWLPYNKDVASILLCISIIPVVFCMALSQKRK